MNRRDALVAGLLAAGMVAMLAPFARLGVDPHHDGIMLKPALDVLSGQVLFRDSFTQYGALTTYLQTAALWLEPSLLSLRLLAVATYGVTLFFLYAAWRLILPRSLTVFSCGLFILFIPAYEKNWIDQYWIMLPWSSVFALLFQSLGLYALFRIIRGEQPVPWGIILGMACAGIFWCRQPVGVITVGCLVLIWLALLWTNWKPAGSSRRSILLGIIAGFAGVNALLLGDILISGAGSEWWYQSFVWPSKWATGTVNLSLRDSLIVFVHPVAAAWLLALGLAAGLPALMRRYRAKFSPPILLAGLLCLGGLLAWRHEAVLRLLDFREGGWTALIPLIVVVQSVISITLACTTRQAARPTEYYLVAALAAYCLGSLLQYYPVPDPWHVAWALAPAFGLFVYVFWRWVDWPAPLLAVVLSVLFLPSLYSKTRSAMQSLDRPLVTLTRPAVLQGMKVSAEQARRYGQIADCLEQIQRYRPEIPSVLLGNDALYLCFTNNRENPSPYYVTWSGLVSQADREKLWSHYILRVRPLVFFHKAGWGAVDDFYRRARYVPLLYLDQDALEIAVPQELADAMGRTVYGAPLAGKPAPESLKP